MRTLAWMLDDCEAIVLLGLAASNPAEMLSERSSHSAAPSGSLPEASTGPSRKSQRNGRHRGKTQIGAHFAFSIQSRPMLCERSSRVTGRENSLIEEIEP